MPICVGHVPPSARNPVDQTAGAQIIAPQRKIGQLARTRRRGEPSWRSTKGRTLANKSGTVLGASKWQCLVLARQHRPLQYQSAAAGQYRSWGAWHHCNQA